MLKDRRIIITRQREQSQPLVEALQSLGARPVIIPAIKISPPVTWIPTDKALRDIRSYDWLVFTSANGVCHFLDRCDQVLGSHLPLTGLRIGVIGAATRQSLESHSLVVSLQSRRGTAEDLACALAEASPAPHAGLRVLFATSNLGRDALPKALRQSGFDVEVIEVYRTQPAEISPEHLRFQFESAGVDDIVFASPSAVRSFANAVRDTGLLEMLFKVRIICLGEVTAAAVSQEGLHVSAIAHQPTVEGIIEALSTSDSSPG